MKDSVTKKVSQSILVTGSARSGTTIMGKVIHSMQNVEYAFEPPSLFPLFANINDLAPHKWKIFFETYLYEDFFFNAISGRNLNFNRLDDSCIYNAKPEEEISKRMDQSFRKHELESCANNGIIAFKMPDIVPLLPAFRVYYPDIKIIFMQRNPVDSINSLLQKGWFSDESLNNENRIWPLVRYKGNSIPYWVPMSDYDYWIELNEVDRYGYYFTKMHTPPSEGNTLVVDYDKLVTQPKNQVSAVADFLNINFGELTQLLISSIQKSNVKRDTKILDDLNPDIRSQIISLVS